ncbi:MAG: ATP-binding cassette domain-containing protein, partial [Promethearchaeota archaeon]
MGIILDVKNLTKRFGGLTAVNDFSFEIDRGEFVGLIGPNGAGKTTVFSLISGFEKPDSGY